MATSAPLTIAARDLKNHTGQALRAAEHGRRVIITRRGRPVAVLIPAVPPADEAAEMSYEDAWQDIEDALSRSQPQDRSWRRAMDRSRRRS
jgi:prevent-host-death family protein